MRGLSAFAAAVLLHEAGHIAAARLLGIPCRRGSGVIGGLRLAFDFSRAGYWQEAAVHLAGPAAGILGAFLAARIPGGEDFGGVSLLLAAVNLLPCEGLDGGGILRCLLHLTPLGFRAESAARTVSLLVCAAFWLFAAREALRGGNLSVLLFAAALMILR
ncbi:MAG: M50 family metallopeptidase [Clostridia bacterium]|nr:M50 family metallopeptidase [Clostridia bacterium]MBR5365643.1 M50 family metallopeptidase [Clostridia bacterium]